MPDPLSQQQRDQRKLIQILDALGTEHAITALLHGGTVQSHLAWLQRQRTPTSNHLNRDALR